jgi:NAD(P)-dependent dehydrogenase (short-subunit alcohol dehydrogenase family)
MKTLFDLSGKVALVTGASSGIGRSIAQALGQHGAKVIIASNDRSGCEKTLTDFQNKNIEATAIYVDVIKKESIDGLVEKSLTLFGKIDVLVSCVGIGPAASFMETESDLYAKVMQTNLQSAIYLTKKILPQMVRQKEGSIMYLASIAAVRGNKNIGLYGISKAGLVQLAKNLAVEYGPDNVRVNAISPGLIDTSFSSGLMEQSEFMEKRLQMTPLRRVGRPEEIAGVAVLLASEAGAFITGQNIIVDGGTTISDGN